MHELTLAMEIVEIAEEYANKAKSDDASQFPETPDSELPNIKEIEIEVGEMAGIIIDSLEFALEIAVRNTILANAKRTIINIPGKAKCNNCNAEFDINDLYTYCPKCNKYDFRILQGNELRVKSITVD